eukprot:30653-Pelagococcus_subviridis.AAC.1
MAVVRRRLHERRLFVADDERLEDRAPYAGVAVDHDAVRVSGALEDDDLVALVVPGFELRDAQRSDRLQHRLHDVVRAPADGARVRDFFVHEHGDETVDHVALRGDGLVRRDDDDGHGRAVLGEERRGEQRVAKAHHRDRFHVEARLDRGGRDGLEGGDRLWGVVPDVGPRRVAFEAFLGVADDRRHRRDSLVRERAVRGLSREHRRVRAVKHRVRDVEHLRSRRQGVIAHGLEHLRRADDELARDVTLSHHQLLREADLLGRDLHAEVAARDHHAVGVLQDVVEVAHALFVLNLADDANVLPTGVVQRLTNELHVLAGLHEGNRDEVHLVLAAEVLHVVDVLR